MCHTFIRYTFKDLSMKNKLYFLTAIAFYFTTFTVTLLYSQNESVPVSTSTPTSSDDTPSSLGKINKLDDAFQDEGFREWLSQLQKESTSINHNTPSITSLGNEDSGLAGAISPLARKKIDEDMVKIVLQSAPERVRKAIFNRKFPRAKKSHAGSRQDFFITKRMLFVGPPGSGKTTLAQVVAVSLGWDYLVAEAPFLVNEYKNSGQQNLLRLFEPIINSQVPYVVIIDEINFLTDRFKDERNSDKGVAEALWLILDRCAENPNILFIGTSNDITRLPDQLKSRFGTNIVKVPLPDLVTRNRVIEYYLNGQDHTCTASDVTYLAQRTDKKSIRDIEQLISDTFQHANYKASDKSVTIQDFKEVIKQNNKWNLEIPWDTIKSNGPLIATIGLQCVMSIPTWYDFYQRLAQQGSYRVNGSSLPPVAA